ncbi:MAG: TIGR00725 family protein [Thermoleophilia bacterium]|nr:TIGR00725 family protein [Thermoleophilia bacterium]
MEKRIYIAVVGGSECTAEERSLATEVGRLVAARGAVLVCGGLGGVMEAAARGAKEAGGTTIGILPGHERHAANPYIDYAVTTGIGHARNLAVASSGDAVIAVGGEYGTLSEIALAAKLGRPVIVLHSWTLSHPKQNLNTDSSAVRHAGSAEEAVELAFAALRLARQ